MFKYTCPTCKQEIQLDPKDHYIGINDCSTPFTFSNSPLQDCYDCPECMCQIIMKNRIRKYNPNEKTILKME